MKLLQYLLALPLALAAPILEARDGAETIPNKWIVVLKQDADASLLSSLTSPLTRALGGVKPDAKFDFGNFKGFSVTASRALIQTVSNLGQVDFIEPDFLVRTQAITTQQNPPYGLARISHRQPGTKEYVYDDSAGQGVVAYGIDTGIFVGHNDFGGRAVFGANFVDKNNTDGNGHGTHTAGTMGSTTYGVAKKVQLVAVKVLSAEGSGASSGIIQGIQFAVQDMKKRGKARMAVANMSLGGPRTSNALNKAVASGIAEGLFFSLAAGNSMAPTLLFTPASEPSACTVGATDMNDQYASFSNFGGLVDVSAPGVDVESTWIDSPDDTNIISGTSMAAPHVGGLAAYLLGLQGPKDPVALCKQIVQMGTKGSISGLTALLTPNVLAYNGATT